MCSFCNLHFAYSVFHQRQTIHLIPHDAQACPCALTAPCRQMPPRPRLKTMPRRGRRWVSAAGLLPAVGLLVYVTVAVMRLTTGGGHPSTAGSIPGAGAGCVAWRNTLACSPYGSARRLWLLCCTLHAI